MNNYIMIGMFIMNGKLNDNNYLYFEIFDDRTTILNNKYSSDLLWLKNTIKELYGFEPFKCVKSKKYVTQVYYNSKELKTYLKEIVGGHKHAPNRSFDKLNNFTIDELNSVVIGIKTFTNRYIYFRHTDEYDDLLKILKNKNISIEDIDYIYKY